MLAGQAPISCVGSIGEWMGMIGGRLLSEWLCQFSSSNNL